MGFIVPAIVILVILIGALVAFALLPKSIRERQNHHPYDFVEKRNPRRGIALLIAAGALALLLIFTAFSAFARVGPREVAVETAFGKFSRTLEAGWQTKAPWAEVETFSTQLQRSEVDTAVAFAESGGGTQHSTVQWAISGDEAEALWSRYKTFENVQDMLVIPATKQATGDVLAGYTPAESRAEGAGEEIREKVSERLSEIVGEYGVTLDSVAMPPAQLDPTAQAAYDRVVEAKANVERAGERKEQARLDAEADELRNRTLTPENLIAECLTVTNNWNDDENGPLPAGWSCFSADAVDLVKSVG